jgi:hypothetical protein
MAKKKKVGRPKGMPRTEREKAADALRPGRPKTGAVRTARLTLRLTPDERETLTREATRRGMTITDMLLEPYRQKGTP